MIESAMPIAGTALLVMDCQNAILEGLPAATRERLLGNLNRVLAAGRKAGLLTGYVVVEFRPGYPEVNSRNERFNGVKTGGALQLHDAGAQVASEIEPQRGDIVVVKKRVSAFAGSDLELILRSSGIDTLVLAGVSTLGVVESTARAAIDMDFRVVVLADGCADASDEAHEAAIHHVIPFSAKVKTCAEFIRDLDAQQRER